ncbi:uncharacterized protein ARMOST_08033 [Armillaria ostoyae]|uniref:Uncharacterized protein n=1 Tax=Armillaria ostoyae TaxID=47428 RepID=A0A284R7F8_ARMOS|nr:uncharacterized protein ARMOST_08033 [Armillaria ostoyae]
MGLRFSRADSHFVCPVCDFIRAFSLVVCLNSLDHPRRIGYIVLCLCTARILGKGERIMKSITNQKRCIFSLEGSLDLVSRDQNCACVMVIARSKV